MCIVNLASEIVNWGGMKIVAHPPPSSPTEDVILFPLHDVTGPFFARTFYLPLLLLEPAVDSAVSESTVFSFTTRSFLPRSPLLCRRRRRELLDDDHGTESSSSTRGIRTLACFLSHHPLHMHTFSRGRDFAPSSRSNIFLLLFLPSPARFSSHHEFALVPLLTQVSPRKLAAETSETRYSLQLTCRLLDHQQRSGLPRYGVSPGSYRSARAVRLLNIR